MRSRSQSTVRVFASAVAVGATTLMAQASGTLHPVALTGTSGPLGPGLGAGVTFSSFVLVKTVHPEFGTSIAAGPSISGTGAVVFGGVLAGSGISTSNGSGIWAARGAPSLSLVARRGDQIPGLAQGYTFGELFTAPQICDTGAVTFQSMVEGNDSSVTMNEATFTERSGVPLALIREGVTIAPESDPQIVFGLPTQNITGDPWGNNGWVINRHGDTALRCFVRDESPQYNSTFGVWTDLGSGVLAKHCRNGEAADDGVEAVHFMGCTNPRLNDSGAFLTGRLTDARFTTHLWSNRALDGNGFGIPGTGPLRVVFVPGVTPAPGTASTFNGIFDLMSFHINSGGRIAFAADLDGGGPGANGGLWSDARTGSLQLIALGGGPAPGVPVNDVFNNNAFFVLGSALADNNVVVMVGQLKTSATVGGGNDTGIWTTRSASTGLPGPLRLLVREGSPVPSGLGPDYDGLNFGEIRRFWVNADGRVAFMTLHNDFTQAIWIEQANGTLAPVVKEFTTIDVSGNGSDLRNITTIDPVVPASSTSDGLATAFNDHGDLAVRIVFSGGSQGIFTTASSVNCQAPAGTVSPAAQQVHLFDTVLFSVSVTGDGPIRYQWRKAGVPIQDATGPTFNALIFTPADATVYDCVLTNFCGTVASSTAVLTLVSPCYANCDGSTAAPVLNVADFTCFLQKYAANNSYANCDGSTAPPILNVADFTCFLQKFAAGCP